MSVRAEVTARPDTLSGEDGLASAREHISGAALADSTAMRVGLEIEYHLVDLADPMRRPGWTDVLDVVADLPSMPRGSSITLEPGGQIELSGPPSADVSAAIEAMAEDERALRTALRARGFGSVALGADPARPVERINPSPRYAAMEQHFTARGCGASGRAMMASTAALQINLDAGPREHWTRRLAHIARLEPIFIALSSTSPYLAGKASGWHSMRQHVWQCIDTFRSGAIAAGEPTDAWADYALEAPVMLLRGEGAEVEPVLRRVSMAEWIERPEHLGRAAGWDDLDYHLTTLFPPLRPRGYLELRCVDSLPTRWWPTIAAVVVTVLDHPEAVSELDRTTLSDNPHRAAHVGVGDASLREAAVRCLDIAAEWAPESHRSDIVTFTDAVRDGLAPADILRRTADAEGPLALLIEECHV